MLYYIKLRYTIVYYSILYYIHYYICIYVCYIIYTLLYIILLHVIYINSVHRINPNHILLHVHMISYVLSLRSLAVSFLTWPRHIFARGATRFHSISQDAVVPVISAGHRDTGSVVIHMVMCHKRTLKDYRLSIRSIWYPLYI